MHALGIAANGDVVIWRLIGLLACLSILDGLLTWDEVRAGIADEANPLMAAVLPLGLTAFLAVKALPIGALAWCCAFTGRPKRAIIGLLVIYSGVIGYHIWGILT